MLLREAVTAGLYGCVTAFLVYRSRRLSQLSFDDMIYFGSRRVRLARVGGKAAGGTAATRAPWYGVLNKIR